MFTSLQVWESAVNLAMSNRKERIGEVVGTIAQRLVQSGRHEAAAELLLSIDDVQGAVQCVLAQSQHALLLRLQFWPCKVM